MMCKIQPLDVSVCKFENKTLLEKRGKEVLEIICDPVSLFPFRSIVKFSENLLKYVPYHISPVTTMLIFEKKPGDSRITG